MSGFEIVSNRIVITNGPRTVATTDGTLLQFLTTEQTFTTDIDFPHVNKTQLYQYEYWITQGSLSNSAAERKARSVVGALPQEWSNTVVLGAAPAGADLFVGRVAMTRTTSPSHTWRGAGITPLLPAGKFFQLTGTILVEAALGISRAMTVDVVPNANPSFPGQLVARLQHSVGPAAGNFRQSGVMPPAAPLVGNTNRGAENIALDGEGIPIWWDDTPPYYLNEFSTFSGGVPSASTWVNRARYGGINSVSYYDPTSYATRYAITVKGRFGRRS